MANKIINIDGREWVVRWSMAAIVAWEEAQGRPFTTQTNTDLLLFLYCIFVAANDEREPKVGDMVPFRRFLDWLDEDEQNQAAFAEVLKDKAKKKGLLSL